MPRIPQLQQQALRILCRGFGPDLPLSWVARVLGFGGEVLTCEAWLRSQSVCLIATSTGMPLLDTRTTLPKLAVVS